MLLFFGCLLPAHAPAQSFDPDAVVVKFQTGDGASHTRTMNQIIADIKSNDEKQSYHSLMQLDYLTSVHYRYALSKLPSATDRATGEVNWIIVRALGKMKKVGRERLSQEMFSILRHAKEGEVFVAVQKTRLIHGHRKEVIEELSRIFMDPSYLKSTRQYAATHLFRQGAAAHARIAGNIKTLYQSEDKKIRLFAFKQIRTKVNNPKINKVTNEKIIELLKAGLKDGYSWVRYAATSRLINEGGKAEYMGSKYLVENIMHGNDLWKKDPGIERYGEFSRIISYRKNAVSALGLFRKYLKDGNHKQKEYAIHGLTLMAKYAKGAEKDLKQISNGGDQELAKQAKAALECLDTLQCGMHRHGRNNRWYSVNP
jgi:hypothetical protein